MTPQEELFDLIDELFRQHCDKNITFGAVGFCVFHGTILKLKWLDLSVKEICQQMPDDYAQALLFQLKYNK